ncbi:MAG: hypothetical protein MPK08_03140 [Alphaproteobacteria bacterium]|nr:hypothetical protein [Alphaproteobacteria bacterium]
MAPLLVHGELGLNIFTREELKNGAVGEWRRNKGDLRPILEYNRGVRFLQSEDYASAKRCFGGAEFMESWNARIVIWAHVCPEWKDTPTDNAYPNLCRGYKRVVAVPPFIRDRGEIIDGDEIIDEWTGFNGLIKKFPDVPLLRYNRGVVRTHFRVYDSAIDDFNSVIRDEDESVREYARQVLDTAERLRKARNLDREMSNA